jgi:hypothetical protein
LTDLLELRETCPYLSLLTKVAQDSPAADICFHPAGGIHNRPSEREICVRDHFGAATGDRGQFLV